MPCLPLRGEGACMNTGISSVFSVASVVNSK